MKLEDFVGLLEAHELRIFERKLDQDSIQKMQAQTWKKYGGLKLKGKGDKSLRKKSFWLYSHKLKNDKRTCESSKEGEVTLIKKNSKRSMCSVTTTKRGSFSQELLV